MNDPISPLHAPPPRYLLESDSSDEEGQGEYPSTSRPKYRTSQPQIKVSHTGQSGPRYKEAIVGVGQAGRYLSRRLGKSKVVATVDLDNRVVGTGIAYGDEILVLIVEEVEGEAVWVLVNDMLKEFTVEKWIVVTTYVPSMYIPDPDEDPTRTSNVPPIRAISAQRSPEQSHAQSTWDPPNYLSGIAAAFISAASHPAWSTSATVAGAIILPLPLSGIAISALTTALKRPPLSSTTAKTISKNAQERSIAFMWDESHDEPFSGLGMGRVQKGSHAGEIRATREELSSMYM